MFHDLDLEDDCAEVIDRFPGVVDRDNSRKQNVPNEIKLGTKVLGKGQKSKSSTAASRATVLPCTL